MNRETSLLEQWLKQYNQTLAHWQAQGNTFTPAIVRESLAALTRTYVTDIPALPVIINAEIGDGDHRVPVRIYHPDENTSLEIALYLHGGGHMAGSVEVYDPICRKIALAAGRIVVASDYRLAPEHPFPAGIEDGKLVLESCFDMLQRLGLKHLSSLALIGDSAGGAMSATLAHQQREDAEQKIDKMVLIYPSLDYSLASPSTDLFGTGYLLEKEKIQWYFDHYFGAGERRDEASPLFMDIPRNFPETMVITAGFCPLHDEGVRYLKRLQDHGVATRHLHFEEMVHAFLNLENLVPDTCTTCYREIGVFLRKSN